ncbi:MAG: hypothetical protein PUF48_03230 [Oscillospiraceae bacterium]|nr:hypothetical protein [Oscillospiraceae bacterium]
MADKKIIKSCENIKLPGSDGVMPIAGFYGPHRPFIREGYTTLDYMDEKYFKMIKDCGINLVSYIEYDYANNPRIFHEFLSFAEKYDLGFFVTDSKLSVDMTEEEFSDRIAEYASYKSFAGMHVTDEPSTDYFPNKLEGFDQALYRRFVSNYAPISTRINSYDNMVGYTNLLPRYHWMESKIDDYERYVREYCETCGPKFLSYDHYVFSAYYEGENPEAFKYFFENFSVIYKCAKEYKLPIWAFVQSGGQWDAFKKDLKCRYYPDAAETLWTVNVSLAYGCKGIQYFPIIAMPLGVIRADGTYDNDRHGLIGPDGLPSRYWAYAKSANEQIRIVDEILLQCESEGLISTGKAAKDTEGLPEFFKSGSFRQLKSVKSGEMGAIIGCFDFNGKTALYVVNNDAIERQEITLEFDDEYTYSLLAVGTDKTKTAKICDLSLPAGGAMLIVID